MPTASKRLADFYLNARRRAQRRKSAWNILLFLICFGCWLACWYVLSGWCGHSTPRFIQNISLSNFRGISAAGFLLSFLMMFSIAPAAMALGFMLGNILIWLIPPARRVLDAEAKGYLGTSFVESMRGIFKFFVWALPIGFAVALTAAYLLNSLR
jgi:hypothetical protein